MNRVKGIIVLSLAMLQTAVGFSQKIVAHRGASYLAPENTISAVELGFELGAEAVEIDVYLTTDKKIIALHDKTTQRTAGVNHDVTTTDSKVLRGLDVGTWKDQKYAGERMPFLEEVFDVVPTGKVLVIEAKSGPEILPYLEKAINNSSIKDQIEVISFNKDVVLGIKKSVPSVPVYWLLGSFKNYSMSEAIDIAKENNLDGLDVNYNLVNAPFVKAMRNAGLGIYVYTVNDQEIARILKDLKVDAITTDRPKWLVEGM